MRRLILLLSLPMCLLACRSDYNLGADTPVELDETSEPTVAEESPPAFSPTPMMTPPTPETGGWVSALRVEPPLVDFGKLGQGCADSATLKVFNDGTVPVEVTNLRMTGIPTAFVFTTQDDLTTLEPGGQGTIVVSAQVIGFGLDQVELQIHTSEGTGPALTVPIKGEGVDLADRLTDIFLQEANSNADVLWVIDNSGSMSDDQLALADNFDAFMASFFPLDVNYNMGVVTTDMTAPTDSGRMQGTYTGGLHYITAAMKEDGVDDFTLTVKKLGDDGSGSEQGLQAMEAALSTDPRFENQQEWNAGFLRPEAFLAVIFVSDEADQSYPNDPSYYISLLETLKGGDLGQVTASAIIPCDTNPVVTGYAEVAYATGGVLAFICDRSYYEALAEVGWVSAGLLQSFPLSGTPSDAGGIEVRINGGEAIPSGDATWSWNPDTNAVVFSSEALPEDGDLVEISYPTGGNCL